MKCDIYLTIGEESILIAEGMDSSLIPSEINEDFLKIIKDSGLINVLRDMLEKVLLEGVTDILIEGIDRDIFKELKYLIANTTAEEISKACPEISFPLIDLSKIKVRIVDKFKNYGTNIIVKTSPNGEPVYLLDGNPTTIKKFARHLFIEEAVNNLVLNNLDENSKEAKTIDKILEKAKTTFQKLVKDRESLIKHFIKNKTRYNKISIVTENGTYSAAVLLDDILPLIENIYYPKNNKYSTPLMRSLHGPGGITYNNGKPQISYNNLYNILSGLFSLSMFKSLKEFNLLMKSNRKFEKQKEYEELLSKEMSAEKSEKLLELIDSDLDFKKLDKFFKQFNINILDPNLFEEENYNILFEKIFSEERGYPYFYSKVNGDGIIKFRSNYGSKEKAYGLSFDTIITLNKTSYKGWEITEHELPEKDEFGNNIKEYFISKYKLLPNTFGLSYESKKEAKAAINKKILEESFRSSFIVELYLNFDKINTYGNINVNSKSETLLKGNVIRIPRISLPNNINILDARESIIFGSSTIEDFIDVVKIWPKEVQDLLLVLQNNPILVRNAEKIIKNKSQEILDLLLDKRTKKILPNALEIILSSESIPSNIKDELVLYSGLIPEVNTVEKAGLFISLLNSKYENKIRTPEMINDILNLILEANKNPIYLYIEDVQLIKSPKRDKKTGEILTDRLGNIIYNEVKQLKVVKIPNPNEIIESDILKNGFQYPVIAIWEEAAQTLNRVFGTKINILTQSEIQDKFGDRYSGEKAFIIGDNVYINSTLGSMEDLFHEYIHIIMGYLKIHNPEIYSNLLEEVWKYTNAEDKRNIRKNYKEDSYISKLEENFAKQFSKYIYKKGNTRLDKIFDSTELNEVTETIFDKADFNLKELGNHELNEIFNRFSSEISMALLKNDKLFGKFAASEEFRLNNKKTNLLQKWIKEGRIKEFNCR